MKHTLTLLTALLLGPLLTLHGAERVQFIVEPEIFINAQC